MTDIVPDAHAVEQNRLDAAAELVTDLGPGWADGFRPGTPGCHELLDRVNLFAKWLDDDLLRHPACVASPEWYALAARAAGAIADLYQKVGAEHLTDD